MTKLFKTQYLSHLRIKNYEIISTKSSSSMVTKNAPNSYYKYLVLILLNFLSKHCSILNHSCIVNINTTKPYWCTLTNWGLFNDTKSKGVVVWEISSWQTKQNRTDKQPLSIDRFTLLLISYGINVTCAIDPSVNWLPN